MASAQWTSDWKKTLSDSQLSFQQRCCVSNVMDSLGAMENQIKTEISNGDFQVGVSDSEDAIMNSLMWVKQSFINYTVSEINVTKPNGTCGYVTVRAQAEDKTTYDDNVEPEAPTEAQETPPVNPKANGSNNTKVEPVDTTYVPAPPTGPADKPSDTASMGVDSAAPQSSEFYLATEVYLEGVQIPHNSVTVSYGIGSPPSCTVILPASSIIRDLPESTKVHVFFQDMLPDASGYYKWRLLFDGEMSGYQYNIDASGATMSISAVHSSAYTTLMQIMTLDASEYLFNPNPRLVGDATIPMLFGQNKVNSKLIGNIMKGRGYESMADIVYQLMRAIIEGTSDSAVGKYYHDELGNDKNGWKILKRIYGVSAAAVAMPVARYDSQYNQSTGKIAGAGTGGATKGSNGQGNDKIVQAALTYVGNTGRDTSVDGISPFECDGLVSASLRKAGCEPEGWPVYNVPSLKGYLDDHSMYSTDPSTVVPGDIIIMYCSSPEDHTGIFMRDAEGKGYLIHNSSSKRETIQTAWEPPGISGFEYVGHGHIE